MFERFTERARQVVVLAQEEARELRHAYIGTEHLLLGLLREEEGLASHVLAALGVKLHEARTALARIVVPGDDAPAPGRQIPFTPRAKKLLELSLREALALGHNYIGTEHLLLGLVREGDGVAMAILLELGVDAEGVRCEVLRMSQGGPGAWQPGLAWDRATVSWNADGVELAVPLQLERRATALLAQAAVWASEPLHGLDHEIAHGCLRLRATDLLQRADPRALRRALDAAVTAAHEEAIATRGRESSEAESFLAALRELPA